MATFDEFVLYGSPTTRNNRQNAIPTRKTPWENYFRFKDAILENGGFRMIRLLEGPGSPIQSKNHVGDAKNVLQKLLPVEGRHLGKWPLSTNSYSMAPPQPETIEKNAIPMQKTPWENYFRFKDAILENGGFRQIRLLEGPGSPIQSRNHVGDHARGPIC